MAQKVGFWWQLGQVIAIVTGIGVFVTIIVLPISWMKSGYDTEKRERKALAEAEKVARKKAAAQAATQPAPPARVATEWMPFTAPPKSEKPFAFPTVPHGWKFDMMFYSVEDRDRVEYVGGVLKGGMYEVPNGTPLVRSKDEKEVKGSWRFTPIP